MARLSPIGSVGYFSVALHQSFSKRKISAWHALWSNGFPASIACCERRKKISHRFA